MSAPDPVNQNKKADPEFFKYFSEMESAQKSGGLRGKKVKNLTQEEKERVSKIAEKIFNLDPYSKSHIQNWIDLNVILYNIGEKPTGKPASFAFATAKSAEEVYQELLAAPTDFILFIRDTQLPFLIGQGFYVVDTSDPSAPEGADYATAEDMPDHVRVLKSIDLSVGLFSDSMKMASHFGDITGLIVKGQILNQAASQVGLLREIKTGKEDPKVIQALDQEIDVLTKWIETEKQKVKEGWQNLAKDGIKDSLSLTKRIMQAAVLRGGGTSSKTGTALAPFISILGIILGVFDFAASYVQYKKGKKELKRLKKWDQALEPSLQVELVGDSKYVTSTDVAKVQKHLEKQKAFEERGEKAFQLYFENRAKDKTSGGWLEFETIKENLLKGDYPIDLEEAEEALKNRILSEALDPFLIRDYQVAEDKEAFLRELLKDKAEPLIERLNTAKIQKVEDLEELEVQKLLLQRFNGKRSALSVSVKNGIRSLAKGKAEFEKNFAKFNKRTKVVAMVLAFASIMLSIGYLVSLPSSLLLTAGILLLAGGIALIVIGIVHQKKYKPNTWKATYSRVGIKAYLQRIKRAFYRFRLSKKFNLAREELLQFFADSDRINKLFEEVSKEKKPGYSSSDEVKEMWKACKIDPKKSAEEKEKLLLEYREKVEKAHLKQSKAPAKDLAKLEEKLDNMETAIARYEDDILAQSWIDYNQLHVKSRHDKDETRFGIKRMGISLKKFGLKRIGKGKPADTYDSYRKTLEDDLPRAILELIDKRDVDEETHHFLKHELGLDLSELEKLTEGQLKEIQTAIFKFFSMTDETLNKFVKNRVMVDAVEKKGA